MKPFDLEKALNRKPVKLRNGWKAYVINVMPDDCNLMFPVRGFCIIPDHHAYTLSLCWTMEGKSIATSVKSFLDIVSMWK